MPTFVQRLQFTVKDHTVGKAATFTKVDNVIQETKNLMNVISKVVTTCFECATKVVNNYHYALFCFIFIRYYFLFLFLFGSMVFLCRKGLSFHTLYWMGEVYLYNSHHRVLID